MPSRNARRRFVLFSAVAILALVVGQQSLLSAPKSEGDKAPAADKPSTKNAGGEKRTAKKPVAASEQTPRMPAHFAKVINDEQRAKLVVILQEFAPQIQQKRAELEALVGQRDKALFKVLSADQKRQVEELRAQANAARAAANSANDEETESVKPAK